VSARRLLKKTEGAEELRKQLHIRADKKLAKARSYWLAEFEGAPASRWLRYLKTQARVRHAA
jgi:hypothetical protein